MSTEAIIAVIVLFIAFAISLGVLIYIIMKEDQKASEQKPPPSPAKPPILKPLPQPPIPLQPPVNPPPGGKSPSSPSNISYGYVPLATRSN